jgi:Zn-dependent M28 family amino/carboxypeptidase
MRFFIIALSTCLIVSAATSGTPALDLSAARILERTRVLASDAMEGRGPATTGEERTVAYLVAECKKIGLAPATADGGYVQEVPMIGVISKYTASWSSGGKSAELAPNTDVVAPSMRLERHVDLKESEMVFLGYGVTAPEYGWDDYAGIDVKGKTVVVLVNDPPVPDPANPAKLDPKLFGGVAMTYYGRWTYKYENASAHGAAACMIIHETGPAAYPFSVVVDSRTRENFTLPVPDRNAARVAVEGWFSLDAARRILAGSGREFDALKLAAVKRGFRPVPLGSRLTVSVDNTIREVRSRNVAGVLPGSDPSLKNEYVIFSSHWDHLGIDPALKGDNIYNGALDNASGVAQILEVAQAMIALPAAARPKRSVVFLMPTAEEKSLLGAKHYAEHPLFPLERTLADINVDGANPFGPTSDLRVVGWGASTIDTLAARLAAGQGRSIEPDDHPERGSYYRADHLEFARAGVPAFYAGSGRRYIGKPDDFGENFVNKFIASHYHKPSDEVGADWTMEGAAQDAEFFTRLGLEIANGETWPEWSPGNEFKARRDAMLRR